MSDDHDYTIAIDATIVLFIKDGVVTCAEGHYGDDMPDASRIGDKEPDMNDEGQVRLYEAAVEIASIYLDAKYPVNDWY